MPAAQSAECPPPNVRPVAVKRVASSWPARAPPPDRIGTLRSGTRKRREVGRARSCGVGAPGSRPAGRQGSALPAAQSAECPPPTVRPVAVKRVASSWPARAPPPDRVGTRRSGIRKRREVGRARSCGVGAPGSRPAGWQGSALPAAQPAECPPPTVQPVAVKRVASSWPARAPPPDRVGTRRSAF